MKHLTEFPAHACARSAGRHAPLVSGAVPSHFSTSTVIGAAIPASRSWDVLHGDSHQLVRRYNFDPLVDDFERVLWPCAKTTFQRIEATFEPDPVVRTKW